MEDKNSRKKMVTGAETGESSNQALSEKVQRIAVSKEAQSSLKAVTDRVKEGFMGGKINLVEMANWILHRFQNELDEAQIKLLLIHQYDVSDR